MRALGMTPGQAGQAAVASPIVAAVMGTTVGVVVAGAASRWFPIGAAGLAEPMPGFDLDMLVLGVGWAGVPLLVLAGSAGAAWWGLRWERVSASGRRSAVASVAARFGLPVPMVVGTRFALEPGQGRTAVPVRPALVGAVAGVFGVVGVFTFANRVSDAAGNPPASARPGSSEPPRVQRRRRRAARGHAAGEGYRDAEVARVNDARSRRPRRRPGSSMTLFSYNAVGTPIRVVLTEGRLATSETKVVLAPTAASALDAEVGSRVRFTGPAGARELSVVGIGFVPGSPTTTTPTAGG